jgi:hypothetical protein
VLAVGGLPMGFLGQWCRTVAEVVGEVHTSMVGIGGVVFGYVAEVGDVVAFGDAIAAMEAPDSVVLDLH